MSISPIVDANYRLQPADLEGAARQVTIANVTYQGVENMTPVLHFMGQTKRLVLSPEQVTQMVEITGTPLFPQWVGVPIILQPKKSQGQTTIQIKAVTSRQRGRPMPVYMTEEKRGWRLALVVVGGLLTISSIYVVMNLSTLLTIIQELFNIWPLR